MSPKAGWSHAGDKTGARKLLSLNEKGQNPADVLLRQTLHHSDN